MNIPSKKEEVYFTDMDSTIICSENRDGAVCVAHKHGRQSSFMLPCSFKVFTAMAKKTSIIPITTRCEVSYKNIHDCITALFKRALVDNGAILIPSAEDPDGTAEEWLEESRQIVKDDKKSFERAREIIESAGGYTEKWGSEFVLDYTFDERLGSDVTPEKLKKELMIFSDILLINTGKKSIACTYKKLSKGIAVRRYCRKFGCIAYLSSGDGKEDESMFLETLHSIGLESSKTASIKVPKHESKLDTCQHIIATAREVSKKSH